MMRAPQRPRSSLDAALETAPAAPARPVAALPRPDRRLRLLLRRGQLPAGRPPGRRGQGDRRADAAELGLAAARGPADARRGTLAGHRGAAAAAALPDPADP